MQEDVGTTDQWRDVSHSQTQEQVHGVANLSWTLKRTMFVFCLKIVWVSTQTDPVAD